MLDKLVTGHLRTAYLTQVHFKKTTVAYAAWPFMSDEVQLDEQTENTQMNWFAAGILLLGSPLFVMAFMGHSWAEIACKVYVWTASVFGAILFFIERPSLKRKWLWMGMIPLTMFHCAVMYGLIVFNLAVPKIDRFPVATYGAMVPLVGLEVGVLELVLGWFKPAKRKERASRSESSGSF